jgi:hypothetical protein
VKPADGYVLLVQVSATAVLQHSGERIDINFEDIKESNNAGMLQFSMDGVLSRDMSNVRMLALIRPVLSQFMHLWMPEQSKSDGRITEYCDHQGSQYLDGHFFEFHEIQRLPNFRETSAAQ